MTVRAHVRQGDPSLSCDWHDDPPQEVRALVQVLFHFAVATSQLRARLHVEPVTFQRESTPCPQFPRKASFLSGVQSRPEFVRSDELVSVQGAADGNKKKVSLERPSHGLRSVVVLSVVCSVPQIVSLVLRTLIGVVSLACPLSLNPLGIGSRLLFRGVPPSRPLCLP